MELGQLTEMYNQEPPIISPKKWSSSPEYWDYSMLGNRFHQLRIVDHDPLDEPPALYAIPIDMGKTGYHLELENREESVHKILDIHMGRLEASSGKKKMMNFIDMTHDLYRFMEMIRDMKASEMPDIPDALIIFTPDNLTNRLNQAGFENVLRDGRFGLRTEGSYNEHTLQVMMVKNIPVEVLEENIAKLRQSAEEMLARVNKD